jgi:polyhydroxyalkanoate synthesis regulator phasin
MNLQETAAQAQQLIDEYQKGNISPEEFRELVRDLDYIKIVSSDTAKLEENIEYRVKIWAAINVAASLVGV